MFMDDTPLYLPGDATSLGEIAPEVNTLLLLPGEEGQYAEKDRQLLQRLMSALEIPANEYRILFIAENTEVRLSALPRENTKMRVINMGVPWYQLGFRVFLPMYHAAQSGNWALVSADLPEKLANDSGLKKMLWNELMKIRHMKAG